MTSYGSTRNVMQGSCQYSTVPPIPSSTTNNGLLVFLLFSGTEEKPKHEDLHPLFKKEVKTFSLKITPEHPLSAVMESLTSEALTSGYIPQPERFHMKTATSNLALGSIGDPILANILQFTKRSYFGLDKETVYDEKVRKGIELTADQFIIENEEELLEPIRKSIKEALFPDAADITCKRYKMAIYEQNGHFDYHRDTIHSVSNIID